MIFNPVTDGGGGSSVETVVGTITPWVSSRFAITVIYFNGTELKQESYNETQPFSITVSKNSLIWCRSADGASPSGSGGVADTNQDGLFFVNGDFVFG